MIILLNVRPIGKKNERYLLTLPGLPPPSSLNLRSNFSRICCHPLLAGAEALGRGSALAGMSALATDIDTPREKYAAVFTPDLRTSYPQLGVSPRRTFNHDAVERPVVYEESLQTLREVQISSNVLKPNKRRSRSGGRVQKRRVSH